MVKINAEFLLNNVDQGFQLMNHDLTSSHFHWIHTDGGWSTVYLGGEQYQGAVPAFTLQELIQIAEELIISTKDFTTKTSSAYLGYIWGQKSPMSCAQFIISFLNSQSRKDKGS